VLLNRLSFEQQFDDLWCDVARSLVELFTGEISNWMRHRKKPELLQSPRARHGLTGPHEDIRDDGRRRNALLFEYYAVEHTARAARPSIADTGNDDVAAGLELIDNLLVRRHSRAALAAHDMCFGAVIFLQYRGDARQ